MTIAVEDMESAAPIASAEGGLRPRRQAAEDDKGRQDKRRRNERSQELPCEPAVGRRRQRARHDEQGRNRQILKQQDGQTRPPGAGMKPFALD